LTGGGARSALWARLVAAAIGQPLCLAADRRSGPAIGAARLARAAVGGPLIAEADSASPIIEVDPLLSEQLARKRALFHEHLS
jgi:xylulokinase